MSTVIPCNPVQLNVRYPDTADVSLTCDGIHVKDSGASYTLTHDLKLEENGLVRNKTLKDLSGLERFSLHFGTVKVTVETGAGADGQMGRERSTTS